MIVMNVEATNILAFDAFKLNFSYPKKIVNNPIEKEYLVNKPNFRYKKVNVIMGSNATGKTSIGTLMQAIVNFIDKKELTIIVQRITDMTKDAKFIFDFLVDDEYLYRVDCRIAAAYHENQLSEHVLLNIYKSKIAKTDSYESCVNKLVNVHADDSNYNYVSKLESIPSLSWLFSYPGNLLNINKLLKENPTRNIIILKGILKVLDPAIKDIVISKDTEDLIIIKYNNFDVLVKKGEVITPGKLSSGTMAGIDIAHIVASLFNYHSFYFCDEKFTFIQSEIEIAIFALMIQLLSEQSQLILTTHNLDLLEMNIPIHSYIFLKKSDKILAVHPEDYIKKNNLSLRNAVENDLFKVSPDLAGLFNLEEYLSENFQKV